MTACVSCRRRSAECPIRSAFPLTSASQRQFSIYAILGCAQHYLSFPSVGLSWIWALEESGLKTRVRSCHVLLRGPGFHPQHWGKSHKGWGPCSLKKRDPMLVSRDPSASSPGLPRHRAPCYILWFFLLLPVCVMQQYCPDTFQMYINTQMGSLLTHSVWDTIWERMDLFNCNHCSIE